MNPNLRGMFRLWADYAWRLHPRQNKLLFFFSNPSFKDPGRYWSWKTGLMALTTLFLAGLFRPGESFGQSQPFSSPGNYQFTVPAGVTSITVKAWGAGGGGGRSDSGDSGASSGGGGGGGGGFRTGTFTVTPGDIINITVGLGGDGANSDDEAGENGGLSSATHTSGEIIALGGGGGGAGVNSTTGGSGGSGGGGSGGSGGFTGGTGAGGSTSDGGKGGGGAGDANNGGNGTGRTTGGGGGAAGGGAGGNGGTSGNDGSNGSTLGGGGGGTGDNGGSGDTGGNGARGQVELTWSCTPYSLTATAATNLTCGGNPGVVTLSGNAASLPVGTYTVTYNLSGANTATGNTAVMIVSVAGSGTFNTSNLNNAGNTTVTVTNLLSGTPAGNCSSVIGANNTATLTVDQVLPPTPGVITGDATICVPNTPGLVYSISSVSGATSYTWTVPTGWTITDGQGTTTITATSGDSSDDGNVAVTASNDCGTSGVRNLSVNINDDNDIGFDNDTDANELSICQGSTGHSLNGDNPPGGDTFTWQVASSPDGPFSTVSPNPGDAEDWTISSTYYNTPGIYYFRRLVSGGNACDGPSDVVTLIVGSGPGAPATPGPVSGDGSICVPNTAGLVYSISSVTNATIYNWTVPTGWTITDGQGTTSITVTAGNSGQNGNITVTASNDCETSDPRNLAVTVNASNDIGFNNNANTNSLEICEGTTGNTLNGANPTGGQTFTWQVSGSPDGPFSTVSPNPGDDEDWTISSTYYDNAGIYYFRRFISGGNACDGSSDVVILTVLDAPVFTSCPAPNVSADTDNGQCFATINYVVEASGSPTYTYAFTGDTPGSGSGTGSGESFNIGITTVTITATNSCDEQTCVFTVTVTDNENPDASCQDLTVQLDLNGTGSTTATAVNNGSSDACGIATLSLDETAFGCSDIGPNAVTLTVTDVNDNTSTCTATVTVEDNVDPTAACQDITVQLDETGNVAVAENDIDDGSSDACGIESLSVSPSGFTCADLGPNTVTLTVTDVNGNTSTCTATVTVEDNVDPTAACQDVTVQLNAAGTGSTTAAAVNDGSSDACGIASLNLDETAFGCSDIGPNAVTLTVTDVNGNTSTCTATVTVEDNVDPTAACQDITVQLDVNGNVTVAENDIDDGSSDACGIESLSVSPSGFTCADLGPNTVTLTVTDVNGNTSTCTATVTVADDDNPCCAAPQAVCQNLTVFLDNTGQASISANDIDDGSTADCGLQSLNIDISEFDCDDVGTPVSVTLTVTDINGNSSTCTATVTVEDNVPATANCKAFTLNLTSDGITLLDPLDVSDDSYTVCGDFTISVLPNEFTCENLGENLVTLTATDVSNGNSSQCQATVTVADPQLFCCELPDAICQDITVQLNSAGTAAITAEDIDDNSFVGCGLLSMEIDLTHFDCEDIGANTVTLTVTDINNDSDQCTATVTVADNVDPEAQCRHLTIQLDEEGAAQTTPGSIDNGSSDACGIGNISLNRVKFDCADIGTVSITLTATDANGNSSTCLATVTVEDHVDPDLECNDLTVTFNSAGEFTLDPESLASATDNCSIENFEAGTLTIECGDLGSVIPVTVTASDPSGNTASCISNVTVSGLPCGWMEMPNGIGCTNGSEGSYDVPSETFSLTASGCYTPSATADESGYIKFALCGNGSITAHIAGLTLPGFAGIVMRESDAPGAKKVALVFQGSNVLQRYARFTTNGPSFPSLIQTPGSRWLRIVRTGNVFRGYHSVNGISWIYSFAVTVPMNSCIQVGLIAWGTNPNSVVTATFDHVVIDPPYTGGPAKPGGAVEVPVETKTAATGVELWPNPSNGAATLALGEGWGKVLNIEITDGFGRRIKTIEADGQTDRQLELDLRGQSPGLYLVKIRDQEGRTTSLRMVVVRP